MKRLGLITISTFLALVMTGLLLGTMGRMEEDDEMPGGETGIPSKLGPAAKALGTEMATVTRSRERAVQTSPSLSLLIDDFRDANPINEVGGNSGGYGHRGAMITCTYTGGVLCLDYDVGSGPWHALYWTELLSMSLTSYRFLSFRVEGDTEGETALVQLDDCAPDPPRVVFKTYHDRYVTALDEQKDWLLTQRTELDDCGVFTVTHVDDGKVAFKTCYGRYVTAMDVGPPWDWLLRAETTVIDDWEKLEVMDSDNGQVILTTHHGRYVTAQGADQGWLLRAETKAAGDWEKLIVITPDDGRPRVSDYLAGPITTSWQRVNIPLADFSEVDDWGCLDRLGIRFKNGRGDGRGRLCLDDIWLQPNTINLPLVLKNRATFCNGGFEMGDLSACWTHGGALSQAVQSEVVFEGSYAALLGSPDYACIEGVPIGEAWIAQTFSVPSCPSPTLSFMYRIFSTDKLSGDKYDSFDVYINGTRVLQDGNTEWSESDCSRPPWDSGWKEYPPYDLDTYGGNIEVSFRNVSREDRSWNTWTYVDQVKVGCQTPGD